MTPRAAPVLLAMTLVVTGGVAGAAGTDGLTCLRMKGDRHAIPTGQGTFLYTPAKGTFTVHGNRGTPIAVDYADSTTNWSLTFAPAAGEALRRGAFDPVFDFPFQPPSLPGMNVQGNGAGCQVSQGSRFTVLEAEYSETGAVERLAVDFEQYCYGLSAAVFGSLRVNATVGLGQRVSVMPARTLEGDAETKALTFQVTLSERPRTSVTVLYATRGGTAAPDADFVPVSGLAWFPPGDVTYRAVVPVLGNTAPQPDRTVVLELAASAGAEIGIGEGTGTIVDDDGGRTYIRLSSDPGDYIMEGSSDYLSPALGGIEATVHEGAVNVVFQGWGYWNFAFAPPAGQQLVPGVYEGARRYPVQSPALPGLDVNGRGRGCNTLSGRFTVFEAQLGAGGGVERLAVDFEHHCDGLAPALLGTVRVNSTVPAEPRLSVAPAAVYEGDGEPVTMRFWVSLSARARVPVTVDWATADGSARAGVDFQAVSGSLRLEPGDTAARVDVPVWGDLVAQPDRALTLVLSGAEGVALGFGEGVGRILDDDSKRTFLHFLGEPGDAAIGDRAFAMTPLNARIRAFVEEEVLFVNAEAGGLGPWWIVFAAPANAPLAPGVYEGAKGYYTGALLATPSFHLSGDGYGCGNFTGRFTVLELERDGDGAVSNLALDYELHCYGAPPAMYGAVRIDSAVRMAPRLSVAGAAVYEGDGEPAALRFMLSLSRPAESPVTVAYATADGAATAGVDYTAVAGTATFRPGETEAVVVVPVLGNRDPQPDRTLSLSLGNPDGAPVALGAAIGTIADDDALTTYLLFDSDPGDAVGQGRRFTLRPLNSLLFASSLADRVRIRYAGENDDWWALDFAPPGGGRLERGYYFGAERCGFQAPGAPCIDVRGMGIGCSHFSGRFRVLDVRYAGDGGIASLALDYEQHCELREPALFGSVRIDSAIPADPRTGVLPRVRQRVVALP